MINGSFDIFQQKLIQKMLDSNRKDSSKNTSTSSRKFDLQVCIDIGDGTTGIIKLDSSSHPLDSAIQFCKQHNINESIAPLIAKSIQSQLKQHQNESKNISFKHRLSQSMIEQTRPQLKQITNITNRLCNIKHNRRKSSQSNLSIHKSRSRKNTQTIQIKNNIQQSVFHPPKINKISQQIVQKLNKKNIIQTIQDNKRKKQSKIIKIRKENDIKQIIECSFKPKINLISQKVDNQMKRTTKPGYNRYEQLYMNSFVVQKSKQHSRKTSFQKNTFKPEINKISKTMVNGINFQQRQQKFRKKPSVQNVNIFKPTTGRQPKSRNIDRLPIGQYLYQKGKQKMNKKNIKTQNNSRRASIVSNKSQELFSNLRLNKLKQIFQALDVNNTGILEYEDLQLDYLDEQTLILFYPIFQEMKQIEVSLNLQEWIEAGSRLIQNLTPQQRSILFNIKKKTLVPQQYSFQPKINRNSRNNSINVSREKQDRNGNRKDIYIRCLMDKKIHKERMQVSKEQLIKNQLHQCTFKPKINRLDKYFN